MKPMIGVTTSISDDETILQMNMTYIQAVRKAGGIPVMLAPAEDHEELLRYLNMVDGVLLTGGGDIDPTLYGDVQDWQCGAISPIRDAFELKLCQMLLERANLPVFGVCRGFQVMNVGTGGDLYQDLQTTFPGQTLAHRQKQPTRSPSHPVRISKGSMLAEILGSEESQVNSHHHQAVRTPGKRFIPVAVAPDGVIEAAEVPEHPFFLGVQWHPERLADPDGHSALLFKTFIDAAAKTRK